MNEILILLSMVPSIEAMWVSVYFLCSKQEFLLPFTIILNFISVLIFLKIIDAALLPEKIEKFLERRLNKKIIIFEKWFQRYGTIVLIVLIAMPFSGVGSFTGALIGRVFELNKKRLYLSVFLGISLSLLPSFIIAHSIHNYLGISCV